MVTPTISDSIKGTNTQREFNRQLEQLYLDRLYQLVLPGEEIQTSYKAIAELTQVPANIVANVMQLLNKEGVLKRRFEYHGASDIGAKDGGGRKAFWTLLVPKNRAKELLDNYQSRLTSNNNNKKEHSVNNITQSKEWVNKTRTYMKGADIIQKNLADLKAAGITVDEEAFMKSINISHDERLSAIALAIPYIESLERRLKK